MLLQSLYDPPPEAIAYLTPESASRRSGLPLEHVEGLSGPSEPTGLPWDPWDPPLIGSILSGGRKLVSLADCMDLAEALAAGRPAPDESPCDRPPF